MPSFTVQQIADLYGATDALTFIVPTGEGEDGQVRARALVRTAAERGVTGDTTRTNVLRPEWSVTLHGLAYTVALIVVSYEMANPTAGPAIQRVM